MSPLHGWIRDEDGTQRWWWDGQRTEITRTKEVTP